MMKCNWHDGFTLLQLMVVVAVLAVLSAIAIPHYIEYKKSSHIGCCKSNLKVVLQTAESVYLITGRVVTDVSDLCRSDARYMHSVPKCPVGGDYEISFSDGQFSVKCTAFDVENHNVSIEESK